VCIGCICTSCIVTFLTLIIPKHCTKSIPYSQALRIKRICSNEETTKKRLGELKCHLKKMRALTIVLTKQVVLTEKTSSNFARHTWSRITFLTLTIVGRLRGDVSSHQDVFQTFCHLKTRGYNNASINHCFNKASGIDRKDPIQYKEKNATTECHLSSHTILCSVIYPTSFVSTGQPYKTMLRMTTLWGQVLMCICRFVVYVS
jgi:hypothetical protein